MQRQITHIHSWDFDGMLANNTYGEIIQSFIRKAVEANRALDMDDYQEIADLMIKEHRQFFDELLTKCPANTKHVVYVGSDRQLFDIDCQNSFKLRPGQDSYYTLSCFPFFIALVDRLRFTYKIDITLEKLLLADAFANTTPGTHFNTISDAFLKLTPEHYAQLLQATPKNCDHRWDIIKAIEAHLKQICGQDPKHARQYPDQGKFLILFMQIQHALLTHNDGNKLFFRFRDDRADILKAAFTSIKEHAVLLHHNVEVEIQQFDPDKVNDVFLCDEIIPGQNNKPISDIRLLFNATREAHHTLNKLIDDNSVPAILRKTLSTERIKLSAADNLKVLMAIEEIIKSIFPTNQPKYARKILASIAQGRESTSDISACLKEIKQIAREQIEHSSKRKGSKLATFTSILSKPIPAEAEQLLRILLTLDTDRPDISQLIVIGRSKAKSSRPSSEL